MSTENLKNSDIYFYLLYRQVLVRHLDLAIFGFIALYLLLDKRFNHICNGTVFLLGYFSYLCTGKSTEKL